MLLKNLPDDSGILKIARLTINSETSKSQARSISKDILQFVGRVD
jgi:hypothetical protein